jgi:hypothetical protein
MMRYYFDMRDGAELIPDEEGTKFWSIEGVQQEAAKTLANMVRDTVLDHLSGGELARGMAVEVRTDYGPVLQAHYSLEMREAEQ